MATDTNFPVVAAWFDSIFPSLFGMVFWYEQQLQETQNYAFIKISASGSYNLQDHLMQNTVARDAKYFLKSAAIDSLQDPMQQLQMQNTLEMRDTSWNPVVQMQY